MKPEERARIKIDKQLTDAGWEIVPRNEYIPNNTQAVKEGLMEGNTESDYLLFVENKAIAVVEAKAEDNDLGQVVAEQAEAYSVSPKDWYGLWKDGIIPLVYLANGNKIYFKNMLDPDSEYVEIKVFHTPKAMLKLINEKSQYGALPRIEKKGLRDCQYEAEVNLEDSIKAGKRKSLAVLATGAGKTYLACLASYRMLNYTSTNRVLFLVDRNNLGTQAETEFSLFRRTENGMPLSQLYEIKRLKKKEDIRADIVISTIQKLFAVMTGASIPDDIDEDEEDERNSRENEINYGTVVDLGDDIKLPRDYFQFIVVDECHRSIYGKWRSVLEYFNKANILGLTATPGEETDAFFNGNMIERYTYDQSVVDGVNVPTRIYRIITKVSTHGGSITKGSEYLEETKKSGEQNTQRSSENVEYTADDLDRSVINSDQIETVIRSYRDSIYTELYPDREENWNFIPKTLIFAKIDKHADQIVEACKKVFGEKLPNGSVPENFVKKITYSAGDSNALINALRNDKEVRIAVTVTLVATGTDVKPLEVVMFMSDVHSEIMYTQMKGRGCRTISEDKLKEVTPNAESKDCFYIVDAVGVTEHDHVIPKLRYGNHGQKMTLEYLLERLAHNEVSDQNLILLRDYCSTINRKYENNLLFGRHLDSFIDDYGFSPKELAFDITSTIEEGSLPPFISPSDDNSIRMNLISKLIGNIAARNHLIELNKGYIVYSSEEEDETTYSGFSKETARSFIDTFEKYLEENRDSVEALRIIYNSEDRPITYSMLTDLYGKLLNKNREYKPSIIWRNYKTLDTNGEVEELNTKHNVNALTNLIQICRYAYKKTGKLTSLYGGYLQRFNLFCGQKQRELNQQQKDVMEQIAHYIVEQGSINAVELNEIDTDLWRRGIINFGAEVLNSEMISLSRFILRMA